MAKVKSIAQLFVNPQIKVLVEDLESCIRIAEDSKLKALAALLHCARTSLVLGAEGQQICANHAETMLAVIEPKLKAWAAKQVDE